MFISIFHRRFLVNQALSLSDISIYRSLSVVLSHYCEYIVCRLCFHNCLILSYDGLFSVCYYSFSQYPYLNIPFFFYLYPSVFVFFFFFFNDPATPEISPLPLHDALPIKTQPDRGRHRGRRPTALRRQPGSSGFHPPVARDKRQAGGAGARGPRRSGVHPDSTNPRR